MYAVIRTGGKQHRVAANDHVTVERLAGEPGATVVLGDVLMIDGGGGEPLIGKNVPAEACVFAEIIAQTRGDKVIIFKRRRRKHYQRRTGHRQDLTVLRIAGISLSGEAVAPAAVEAAPAEPATAEPAPAGDMSPGSEE